MADHERRRQKVESSCRSTGTSCDSNNNTGETTSNVSSAREKRKGVNEFPGAATTPAASSVNRPSANNFKNSQLKSFAAERESEQQQQQRGGANNLRRISESNASESDDWHLLDVDEQSELSKSSSSIPSSQIDKSSANTASELSNSNNHNRSSNERTIMTSNGTSKLKVERINEHYLEVEPLDRHTLSPALVYFCTVLYSFLPLASLLTFFTLIYLLFTKFWLITVVYYSYLIFDAKTCNRGGRRWNFVYGARFWSYLAAIFPLS